MSLYKNLITEFGDPINYWPQWCARTKNLHDREKIVMSTILVQRTTWHNANIALKRLRDADFLSIEKIANLSDLEELTQIIRPAGFFQSKPNRLFDVCTYIKENGGLLDLMKKDKLILRNELLKIKGIGKETADTILLYALDMPSFIIDEYTFRWCEKNNLLQSRNYDILQNFFQDTLLPDVEIYRNFHTLIIVSQVNIDKSKMEMV